MTKHHTIQQLDKWLALVLATTLFLSGAYFYQGGGDNENSRFAQVRALVQEGKVSIERFAYRSTDIIRHNGRLYPNKAPGLTLASVPPWYLMQSGLSLFMPTNLPEDTAYHLICYGVTLLSVTLWSAIGLGAFFLFLRTLSIPRAEALLLSCGFGFATFGFPFSTLYFSHQFTVGLICLALFFFRFSEINPPKGISLLSAALSGFLLAFAISSEYPAAIVTGLVGLLALKRFPQSQFLVFFIGGVLGIIPLLLYNWFAFGDVLFIPYSAYSGPKATFQAHQRGLLGVVTPRWDVLAEILYRPQRGLLWLAPWLGLLVAAIPASFFAPKERRDWYICSLFIVIFFLIFNAGYGPSITYWGGGASVGPRHILPAIPFIVFILSSISGIAFFRFLLTLLIVPAALIALVATAVEPKVPYEFDNPVVELFWRQFLKGEFGSNITGVFSNSLMTVNSVSFNGLKLLGWPGWTQLIPVLVLWLMSLVVFEFLLRKDGKRGGLLLNVLRGGTVSVFALCALVPWSSELYSQYHAGSGIKGECFRGVLWNKPHHGEPMPVRADMIDVIPCGERIDQKVDVIFHEEGFPTPGPFSMEWSGTISIPEKGVYWFGTGSDDGSALYIDEKLLVDNWGEHGYQLVSQDINLEKGTHQIRIRYFNTAHGAIMKVFWGRDRGELQVLDFMRPLGQES